VKELQNPDEGDLRMLEERRKYHRFRTAIPIHHRVNSRVPDTAAPENLEAVAILRNVSLEGILIDFWSELLELPELLPQAERGPSIGLEMVADSIGVRLPVRGVVRWYQVGKPQDGITPHLRAGICLKDPESYTAVTGILRYITGLVLADAGFPRSAPVFSPQRGRHPQMDTSPPVFYLSDTDLRPRTVSPSDQSLEGKKIEKFNHLPPGYEFEVSLTQQEKDTDRRMNKRIPVDFPVLCQMGEISFLSWAVNACKQGMMVRAYPSYRTTGRILTTMSGRERCPVQLAFTLRSSYRVEVEIKHFHYEHSEAERCRCRFGFLMPKTEYGS
jgi:hypothetical protein